MVYLHMKHQCYLTLIYSGFLSLTRFVLKGFAKDGRDLTDKETKAFLKAADKDGDGKIGVDGKRPVPSVGILHGHTNTQGQSVFICCSENIKIKALIKRHDFFSPLHAMPNTPLWVAQ